MDDAAVTTEAAEEAAPSIAERYAAQAEEIRFGQPVEAVEDAGTTDAPEYHDDPEYHDHEAESADPQHPEHGDYLRAEMARVEQETQALIIQAAEQAGLDPMEALAAWEHDRNEWRAQREAAAQVDAAVADDVTRQFLGSLAAEVGEFDGDAVLESARTVYAEVERQHGGDIAAQLGPEIVREAARQDAEERRAVYQRTVDQSKIGSYLAPGAAYDPALAMSTSMQVYPALLELTGDELIAKSQALDIGNRAAAYSARGVNNGAPVPAARGSILNYYDAKANQIRRQAADDPKTQAADAYTRPLATRANGSGSSSIVDKFSKQAHQIKKGATA